MSQYKWLSRKTQNPIWTWLELESFKGTYEIVPLLHSHLGNHEIYVFEITLKGKMIAMTPPFMRSKLKAGRAAGRILAQRHLEA